MKKTSDFIVVGGGIWGLSTAYHLMNRGAGSVRILERNSDIASETTPQAAGLVGQIRSSPTMSNAIRYALDLFEHFGDRTGQDTGLRRPGSLMVALTPERMEAYQKLLDFASKTGIDASIVAAKEMKQLCPDMDEKSVEGGLFVNGDGYVDARQCSTAYATAARNNGAVIDCNVAVTGFDIRNGKVRGVITKDGTYTADQVIVTCGPWTAKISELAGVKLAMQTIRHQRVRTEAVLDIPDDHPVVRVTDVSCYMRPDQDGYLYGFFEPDPHKINLDKLGLGFRTDSIAPPHETIKEATKRLAPVFPVLKNLEIEEYRQGITSFAPDGKYLIGPVPNIEGLFVASGCAAIGIAGSAAIGLWLAEWVTEGQTSDNVEEFGLQRFGSHTEDKMWVEQESMGYYANYYSVQSMGSDKEK